MLPAAIHAANRLPAALAPPLVRAQAGFRPSYRAIQPVACRLPVVGPVPSRSCPSLPLQCPSKTVFRVLSLVRSFSPSRKEKARQPPSAISGSRLTPFILETYKEDISVTRRSVPQLSPKTTTRVSQSRQYRTLQRASAFARSETR